MYKVLSIKQCFSATQKFGDKDDFSKVCTLETIFSRPKRWLVFLQLDFKNWQPTRQLKPEKNWSDESSTKRSLLTCSFGTIEWNIPRDPEKVTRRDPLWKNK